ncbi:MAG: hypothetical protein ACOX0H_01215 [Patescibacteria group bacterium]|jgi:hypothetical protein|nr:hypothetical protein [bacterium]HQC49520.1 hypothetical protein [bacterium]
MKINKLIIIPVVVFGLLFSFLPATAASLSGRILLQVQDKGQAWYINPLNNQRYFLGRPDDAFRIMREFGLGVSNRDLNQFLATKAPSRLAGRILLQVEDKGQAYYIEPLTLNLHYLGRPLDAFNVIRSLGLGITNSDLNKIPVARDSAPEPATASSSAQSDANLKNLIEQKYNFKYKNTDFSVPLTLSTNLYNTYSKLPKVYSYLINEPPPNIREAFYDMFLHVQKGDTSIDDLVSKLKTIADQKAWSQDELLEFTLALIQYIPYDDEKAVSAESNPFYHYETLYLNKGVCSDKVFLAHLLFSRLGYGVAIMDFPDINHSAIGIACPLEDSIAGSGYCYGETTNYFPIGVIPNNIDGQAQTNVYGFDNLFDESKLGTIEIFNKTKGRIYQGASTTKKQINQLSTLYQEIISTRETLAYDYAAIAFYNQKVNLFNGLLKEFYQQ